MKRHPEKQPCDTLSGTSTKNNFPIFIMRRDNPLMDVIPDGYDARRSDTPAHLLTESHTVPVATTGRDGKPNVAGKSVMVMKDKISLLS